MEEVFLMSTKEIERHETFKRVDRKELKLKEAAQSLGVSNRQAIRLYKRYKEYGLAGLKSKHRGRTSNRAIPKELEKRALDLIEEHYHDFSPTLATEKLSENHDIHLSREKVRQMMIEGGFHEPKIKKKSRVYQRRKRRSCFGELTQIDASPHDWFEGRAAKCALLAGIDDATGKVVAARFEPTETTNGYFRLVEEQLNSYGRPLTYYSDKYSVFKVNHGNDRSKKTQFKRAMDDLGIELICAHSPQAKGRIERLFGTLQDRLVKEMRLKGVSSIEEANAFLPSFLIDFNNRFGCTPSNPADAHLPLKHNCNLGRILCRRESRKVSKNLEISWYNRILQIQAPNRVNRLQGVRVEVLETLDGDLLLEYKGSPLIFKQFVPDLPQPKIFDYKEIGETRSA